MEEEGGGGTLQRLNHKSLRMPEEGKAFNVHYPYLQMRNLMHRWEVMASRLLIISSPIILKQCYPLLVGNAN